MSQSDPSRPHPSARFSIRAASDPAMMPRLLQLFAKRSVVPDLFECRRDAEADLRVAVIVTGLETKVLDHIAQCMRQIVGVESVVLAEDAEDREALRA